MVIISHRDFGPVRFVKTKKGFSCHPELVSRSQSVVPGFMPEKFGVASLIAMRAIFSRVRSVKTPLVSKKTKNKKWAL